MKSAYEIALERLEQQGIDRPSDAALSEEVRGHLEEAKRKARAALAELEIMHRDRAAKISDPAELRKGEEEYRRERSRIEERRESEIRRLRSP